MAGRVRCPECRSVFPLPEDRDGEFFCPRCRKRLVIPGAGSRPKHEQSSEPEHDYVPAYEVRRAPGQRPRPRREGEWDEGGSFGRVKRKAGRSRLIWLIVGLGTP